VIVLVTSLAFLFNNFNYAKTASEKLAKKERALEKILGTNSNWKPTVFKDLKRNMPYEQVKNIKKFRHLQCKSYKSYDFPKVTAGFGSIKEYKFTFKRGLLQNATIVFGARLFDEKRFYTALLNVAQRKWGELSSEKLNKRVIVWTNSDLDIVTLSKIGSNYQTKVSMPKYDSGDVIAGSLSEQQIRSEFAKLMGSNKSIAPKAFSSFKYNMSCVQVKSIYSSLKGCAPTKSWSFGSVTIVKHPLIHRLKFSFKLGYLQNITILFHRNFDYNTFKRLSLDAFENKWGRLSSDAKENDILTKFIRGYGIVQRNLVGKQWQIKFALPKI